MLYFQTVLLSTKYGMTRHHCIPLRVCGKGTETTRWEQNSNPIIRTDLTSSTLQVIITFLLFMMIEAKHLEFTSLEN